MTISPDSNPEAWSFETKQIHAGQSPDTATRFEWVEPRQQPPSPSDLPLL